MGQRWDRLDDAEKKAAMYVASEIARKSKTKQDAIECIENGNLVIVRVNVNKFQVCYKKNDGSASTYQIAAEFTKNLEL